MSVCVHGNTFIAMVHIMQTVGDFIKSSLVCCVVRALCCDVCVCVYVCLCLCVSVCVCAHAFRIVYVHACAAYSHTHTHIYTHTHLCVCVRQCTSLSLSLPPVSLPSSSGGHVTMTSMEGR